MKNQTSLRPKLLPLLLAGGVIVIAVYTSAFMLGTGTWREWWAANGFHALGGAYAFFFMRALWTLTLPLHRTQTARWMEMLILIAGAIALGVAWEWYELIVDRYHVLILRQPSIMWYADNIGDLGFDAAGALVAALISYGKRK